MASKTNPKPKLNNTLNRLSNLLEIMNLGACCCLSFLPKPTVSAHTNYLFSLLKNVPGSFPRQRIIRPSFLLSINFAKYFKLLSNRQTLTTTPPGLFPGSFEAYRFIHLGDNKLAFSSEGGAHYKDPPVRVNRRFCFYKFIFLLYENSCKSFFPHLINTSRI